MASAHNIAQFLDGLLEPQSIPDFPGALNGLQLDHTGPVTGIAASVDVSLRSIEGAIDADANLLVVHHGLFWSGPQRMVGVSYQRLKLLYSHDIAVYASHLPLDAHTSLGNNALLTSALGLTPTGSFGQFHGVSLGLSGTCDVPTSRLAEHIRQTLLSWEGGVVTTWHDAGRITRKWGICSGAGASSESLREAVASGIDTLIVGEGPHHTAVDAPDLGLVVIYAGHYATETLGVQAIARAAAEYFGLPWAFVHVPSGL
jgi:dinuclear metal center YbgI/SA1388 family protein